MDDCWLWARTIENDYGRIWIGGEKGKHYRAHRIVYEALVGEIPSGLSLDHLCRIKRCVNPAHLEPVTHQENVKRGNSGKFQKAKTHCPQGHEYNSENTYIASRGKYVLRACRTCKRESKRRIRHENSLLR